MKRIAVAAIVLTLASPNARAQTSDTTLPDNRCWFASKTFSVGATVRVSDKVMVCGDGATWGATNQAAAGCFRDGDLFAVGSTESIPNKKGAWLECTSDGSWKVTSD